MPLISNTGPILSFVRAHHLDLLSRIVGTLMIPHAVYDEIVIQGAGLPGSTEVEHARWITRMAIRDHIFMNALPHTLHKGEREAITLAKEHEGALLIDDQSARRVAQRHGITCLGSLRVLEEGKERGTITAVRPILDALIAAGMYVSDALYISFLSRLGEGDQI